MEEASGWLERIWMERVQGIMQTRELQDKDWEGWSEWRMTIKIESVLGMGSCL